MFMCRRFTSLQQTRLVSSDADRSRRSRYAPMRSEEHTSELQSRQYLVCRLLLEKKKNKKQSPREAKRKCPRQRHGRRDHRRRSRRGLSAFKSCSEDTPLYLSPSHYPVCHHLIY